MVFHPDPVVPVLAARRSGGAEGPLGSTASGHSVAAQPEPSLDGCLGGEFPVMAFHKSVVIPAVAYVCTRVSLRVQQHCWGGSRVVYIVFFS